jgi:chromosome segregation ATPase
LERERDEGREALERAAHQQGAEERSLRAEISLLHGRLEASREAGRSAIAALRGTVERAEKVAQERCASTVAMEGEIADLRQAVARATLEAERRAANAGELQVKIASLRGMVDRAEQVVHDRDAAAEAMGDEIASLRNDIAAARQVGRAMFAALRVDPKPSLNRDGRDRWWRAGSRMLGLRYASIPPLAPNRET